MQNQNPLGHNSPTPESNISPAPTPGTPPPAQYPYPSPSMPNGPAPAQYPSPSIPNEPAPAQYPSPSIPNEPAPAQYPYPFPSIPNAPVQYPYSSPYQQQYPAYTPMASSTNNSVVQASLIGGAIACGIDTLITLLLTFVPAIGNMLTPLYQFGPLLPADMLSVGDLLVSLIVALLCSPGFFVVGLQAIRKTDRMNAVMLACTLALAGFAVIDLTLAFATAAYVLLAYPSTPMSGSFALHFWGGIILGWFIDLIMTSLIAYAAASLGATLGKQPRY